MLDSSKTNDEKYRDFVEKIVENESWFRRVTKINLTTILVEEALSDDRKSKFGTLEMTTWQCLWPMYM